MDSVFSSLPLQLQQRIDCAFDQTAAAELQSFQPVNLADHHRNLSHDGGGFLLEPVGAIPNQLSPPHIPLSAIPSALQLLDLPPDDEQVLSVFRNAASGWTSSSNRATDGETGEGLVSQDDWRSVCAVLLEHHGGAYPDDSEIGPMGFDRLNESDKDMESDDQLSADDDSGDEYVDGGAPSSSRRHQAKHKPTSVSPLPSPHGKLSPSQQQTCLEAFALFFPSVRMSEIANQKIMIKDIQRVSKLLGEKIKANEMLEMLEAFSTTADKSVGLADFGRMMVAAKLA